jgi:N-acetylmuramoyl-L-alanine amidase
VADGAGTRAAGMARGSGVQLNGAHFELTSGAETVRTPLPLNLVPLEPALARVAVATPPADAPSDWTTRGRNAPGGPFHFFWPPGTRMTITGERNGMYRVRLAADRVAWVPAAEVRLLPEGTPPPRGAIDGARMSPQPGYIDLRVPLPERVPFHVVEQERTLSISVFGATSRINFFQYGGLDPLIGRAEWLQPSADEFRVDIHLTEPVWGYEAFFDGGAALVLRVRRPPRIDADRPLAGLLVALDAGHPPGGAIGPTGLTEAEANLRIALKLQPMLEAAGARVLMTRTDDSPVDLNLRPRMARDSNAHVLISVHNNAFPDGVNPFENNGTSVYYFHPHSADMARLFQGELLRELGLRDLGIGRADLALVRGSWMPGVLTETSFLMMPQQEAALRDPSVQERIARAHLRALETFLRSRANAR